MIFTFAVCFGISINLIHVYCYIPFPVFARRTSSLSALHTSLTIVNRLARQALLCTYCLEKKAARTTSKKFRRVSSVKTGNSYKIHLFKSL